MLWIFGVASLLAAPMLLRWQARFFYAATLLYGLGGLIAYAIYETGSPDHHGSPGDAFGLGVLVVCFVMLAACLLLMTLIRLLALGVHRRWQRSRTPDQSCDC
ncbi:hypothetical protein PY254_06435 [Rhodanobacter sp. AS-Z3]|uniref:hypothetical protein n=1 Tax=Rhodanobacter sp. AS-Z3 TaxID=3031330 RepID=UPI0024795D1A|nr:hypothetical protein [Rhodanobacter sp. AS-Z3]WEN16302.1 hypothetical protein PY254_06435 [Rhodanobacter sp. AS-Z3]